MRMRKIGMISSIQFEPGKPTRHTIMTSIVNACQADSSKLTLFQQVFQRGNSLRERKHFDPFSDSVHEGSDHDSDYEDE